MLRSFKYYRVDHCKSLTVPHTRTFTKNIKDSYRTMSGFHLALCEFNGPHNK